MIIILKVFGRRVLDLATGEDARIVTGMLAAQAEADRQDTITEPDLDIPERHDSHLSSRAERGDVGRVGFDGRPT